MGHEQTTYEHCRNKYPSLKGYGSCLLSTYSLVLSYSSSPTTQEGIAKCFESVIPGVYMNSSDNAYLRVNNPTSAYSFNVGFTAEIRFRTTDRDATLIIIYQGVNEYMLLDIYQGIVSTRNEYTGDRCGALSNGGY